MNSQDNPAPLSPPSLNVGFHENIDADRYHADPCVVPSLSSSVAAELVTSAPAKARLKHPRLVKQSDKKATDEMNFGSVVHELALGRGGGFAVWEGETWRGGEAAKFWDAAVAAGKTPIKTADLKRATDLVDSVRIQLKGMGLDHVLSEGKSEVVAVWKNGDHYARAMYDKWFPDRDEIWDIKTTGLSAHPEKVARHVANMNYDLRSEFYLMGAEKLTGKPSKHGGLGYQFLFIETSPPYLPVPCYLDATFKIRGRRNAQHAIDLWARCIESGVWPGYTSGPVEIMAPGYIDFEIEETGITASGERIV
jgi:hypothetical protein